MKRFGFVVVLLASLAGCVTEYQSGYNQAVQDVRETRKKGDLLLEGGMQLMDALDSPPVNAAKSADWNAGYRQGFRDEVRK